MAILGMTSNRANSGASVFRYDIDVIGGLSVCFLSVSALPRQVHKKGHHKGALF
jgi:hypothetical protein